MKKFLKVLLAGVLAVCTLSCFTACNGGNENGAVELKVLEFNLTDESYAFAVNEGNTTLKTQVDDYLNMIKDNGTFQTILDKYLQGEGAKVGYNLGSYDATKDQLVVLTNTPFEPFEYTDSGKYYGIDIEIAGGLATHLNKELCIVEWPVFDTILNQFNTYPNAIVMAGLTVDSDRELVVDFTQEYFKTSQKIIYKDGDTTFANCNSLQDVEAVLASLEGKKIGFQTGTQGGYYLEGYENIEASPFATAALAAQALKNGSIDYVIVDEKPAEAIVANLNALN